MSYSDAMGAVIRESEQRVRSLRRELTREIEFLNRVRAQQLTVAGEPVPIQETPEKPKTPRIYGENSMAARLNRILSACSGPQSIDEILRALEADGVAMPGQTAAQRKTLACSTLARRADLFRRVAWGTYELKGADASVLASMAPESTEDAE